MRFQEVLAREEGILAAAPGDAPDGEVIGHSRQGRPIAGYRFGRGRPISLLAGCHADEPVGPRLLRHLVAYLAALPVDDRLLRRYEWWVVPHINPDGEDANRRWQHPGAASFDLGTYLAHVVREGPGDDIEFGFPVDPITVPGSRPENQGVLAWWERARAPFLLHVSLHGMGFAAGPWFLIEPAWRHRVHDLRRRCTERVAALGYRLHDVERHGDKGFDRLGPGFATRPSGEAMRAFFRARGDAPTALLFRESSMDAMRMLGGDPLTLVTEMPLFVTPGVGEQLGPPDPAAEVWRDRLDRWRQALQRGAAPADIAREARDAGLVPMPIRDQMRLQWTVIAAGVRQVGVDRGS